MRLEKCIVTQGGMEMEVVIEDEPMMGETIVGFENRMLQMLERACSPYPSESLEAARRREDDVDATDE